MKIKCPGCSATLQIPESAAGKVVKCKCGKQLRAPGGQAAAPAQSRPAAAPRQARPAPPPPASPGLFDELTDTDLSPIKSVQIPGAKAPVKAPGGSAAKMLDEAISGSDRRGAAAGMKEGPKRPGFLTFLGVVNGLSALAYIGPILLISGVIKLPPAAAKALPDLNGPVFYIFAALIGLMVLLSLTTSVACFKRGRIFWYIVLASYGFSLAFNCVDVAMRATGGEIDKNVIRGILGIPIGGAIWAWLHTKRVREYYLIENEPIWRTVLVDAIGFLIAGGLGIAVLVMR